ncbi:MAG: hypothetical protein HY054_01480 [Proteobacteria bacterium]|nr:hypothetical protein [Pseudomonadota bacterium]
MCGNEDNGLGIIMGLIAAAAILVFAFAEKHAGAHAAPPAQHTISAPATHVALELSPITLDIDLANARVSLDVRL